MKQIIINDKNLKDDEIDLNVVRVKALIINSRGKILLAHNNNTYQFPGGHVEDNETIVQCVEREIKEETGIKIFVKERPFLCISGYYDNYFDTGKKVKSDIYYFRIFTDTPPNFEETHYDELELSTEFNLFYVDFKDLDKFLKKKIEERTIDEKIAREMLHVVDEYKNIFGLLK